MPTQPTLATAPTQMRKPKRIQTTTPVPNSRNPERAPRRISKARSLRRGLNRRASLANRRGIILLLRLRSIRLASLRVRSIRRRRIQTRQRTLRRLGRRSTPLRPIRPRDSIPRRLHPPSPSTLLLSLAHRSSFRPRPRPRLHSSTSPSINSSQKQKKARMRMASLVRMQRRVGQVWV